MKLMAAGDQVLVAEFGDRIDEAVNDQVHAVIEDSEGDLWFGTSNGISFQDSKTGQWHSFLSSYDS